MGPMGPGPGGDDISRWLRPGLEMAIAQELVIQQAEKEGLNKDPDYLAQVELFELQMRQREIMARADHRVDLEIAVAAAGQSGVARTEEEAHTRRTDSMREADAKDEAARERAIREALTKAGMVEAEAQSELVTRFAEHAFEQDLGRPERTVEYLGNRSSSPSKLND